MSARSRRLQESMGSSWGAVEGDSDAQSLNYSSDEEVEADIDNSDEEWNREHKDKATPLPAGAQHKHSSPSQKSPKRSPLETPRRQAHVNSAKTTPRSPASKRSTPKSAEPTFYMPTLTTPTDGYSEMRTRRAQHHSRKQGRPAESASYQPQARRAIRQPSNTLAPAQEEDSPWYYVGLLYNNILHPLLAYFFDIFGYTSRHVFKPLFALALAAGLIYFGLHTASGLVYSKVNAVLAPVCLIPGSSYVLSACATASVERGPDFEKLMDIESHFEDIIESSKDTNTQQISIKDSELAVRDLRILVQHSSLPSRHQLDLEFTYFIQTAKAASYDLTRYNTRLGGTIDRVIGTNTVTMAVLHGLDETEKSKGTVARIANAMLGSFIAPEPTLSQRIFDRYTEHISINSEHIDSLIHDASALLQVLEALGDRLDSIHSLTAQDDKTITRSRDELLSNLWTKLGGNSRSVKEHSRKLKLLNNISTYRHSALKHVSASLLKLQQIQGELENLREGVAGPGILGWREGVPLEYHMDLIERSVERLRVARGDPLGVAGQTGRTADEVRELGDGRQTPVVVVKG